ncbi:MAG: hypothetical protein D6815_12870 [Candidatus Dadabacteria bacterium]|nr:MAG: hypothetical protein D6815_12870 [Candidatus Dadabacteria bacterium]
MGIDRRRSGIHNPSVCRHVRPWRSPAARRKNMIAVGETAPAFSLKDQFGREVSSEAFRNKHHLMLLFYPLDWTPT